MSELMRKAPEGAEPVQLQAAWELLHTRDRSSFWDFAADEVQNYRPPKGPQRKDNIYDSLCAAVVDADRPITGKPAIIGFPRSVRRLSADELRRAVRRLKERLLVSGSAHEFLTRVYCRWTQYTKTPALLAALDALGCGHDEVGNLVGSIPRHDPSSAQQAIAEAAKSADPYELAVVCSAMALNNHEWRSLWSAIPPLTVIVAKQNQEGPEHLSLKSTGSPSDAHDSIAPDAASPETNPGQRVAPCIGERDDRVLQIYKSEHPAEPVAINDEIEDLRTLARTVSGLLEAAVGSLSGGGIPDPAEVMAQWSQLDSAHARICDRLGIASRKIQDLEEAAQAARGLQQMRADLSRLVSLRHASDGHYSAHLPAAEDAAKAIKMLDQGKVHEAQAILTPLRSLLALIDEAASLSDSQAAEHTEAVRAIYGPVLPLSAQRGSLACGDQDTDQRVQDPVGLQPENRHSTAAADQGLSATQGEAAQDQFSVATNPDLKRPQPETVQPVVVEPEPGLHAQSDCLLPQQSLAASLSEDALVPAPETAPEVRDPEAVPRLDELPLTTTFVKFRSQVWISGNGQAQPAPWAHSEFGQKTAMAASSAWESGQFGLAYLLAAAASVRGGVVSQFELADLEAAAALLERRTELVSIANHDRAARLAAALAEDARISSVALALEAVAPTLPASWSAQEAHQLCRSAGLNAHCLEALLVFVLTGWSSAADPLAAIREHLNEARLSPAELDAKLKAAQDELQRTVVTLWSAAGGRIIHTHCKKAWMRFMRSHVAPLRDLLVAQPNRRQLFNLSADAARSKVAELGRSFALIMGEEGVKHGDRTAAQTGAEQIVAAVQKVIDAKNQLESARRRPVNPLILPVADLKQLADELPSTPGDRICALILRAAWSGEKQPNPLRVPSGYLRAAPELVTSMKDSALADPSLCEGIPASAFADMVPAAALLMSTTAQPTPFGTTEELLDYVRNWGIEQDRADVLAALLPSGCLQPHEKSQLHRKALELGDQAYQSTRTLDSLATRCDELLAPQRLAFRELTEEAYRECSFAAGEAPIRDVMLLQAWIQRGLTEVQSSLSAVEKVRSEEADRSPRGIGNEFRRRIAAGDHRGAMALFNPEHESASTTDELPRRTLWRSEAVERFPNPKSALVSELRGTSGDQGVLASWWVTRSENDPSYPSTLTRTLYNVISGEAGHTGDANKRRFNQKLSQLRQHRERQTVVQCSIIREYFQFAKLNPTFLPQLAEFDEISIALLPTAAQAATSIDNYIAAAKGSGQRVLGVFLEPGITPARRDEIVSALRRRKAPIVILDDIDVCRLCLVGMDAKAHNFIPFLEVVFEQLDLELISPFSSLDGQHIRLETFVGRATQADAIARNWEYSRLFSGRKLGKSAFLRFLASKYDGSRLSSNRQLRVLFISIAGMSTESAVAETVIGEMSRRFAFIWESESNAVKGSVERFAQYIDRFCKAQRFGNDDVLVILDEADAFVEDQLRNYDKVRDKSLSFYMMKRLPVSEGSELPRVRFLFAGYRVTNTRGGVWANAGDVLILKPLAQDDAVQFLHGMLGRVGVDIGSHAPFAARRCGYQPAVLIRFGDALLKRLRRNLRTSMREHYRVSYDDVIATMSDPGVTEEIRTVVNNNFQGNRIAAAVFAATLLSLKDVEPGTALENGQQRVLDKLREVDPDTSWLAGQGADSIAQVDRLLQDFIDRELLTATDGQRFGRREYRLKFPHFMSVFEQQDLAFEIRQHIQYLKENEASTRIVESVLPDASLEAVRYVFRESATEECKLGIVAGFWPQALTDAPVGIPDRLDCATKAVSQAESAEELAQKLPIYRIFRDVPGAMLTDFLAASHKKPLLLLGGLDLLRVALRRQLEGADSSVDVRPFVTMTQAAVSWWFKDARALHCRSDADLDPIFEATRGIPLLVQAVSDLLPHQPSSDLSRAEIATALAQCEASLPALAQQLMSGSDQVRLTARELDLLRMARHVAKEVHPEFDLEADFADAWNMCAKGGPLEPFQEVDDRSSMQLLMCVGLLPAAKETSVGLSGPLGKVSFAQHVLLCRLLDALGTPCET